MKKRTAITAAASLLLLEPLAEALVLTLKKSAPELPDYNNFDYYSANAKGKRFEDAYNFLSGVEDAPRLSEEDIFNILSVQSEYMYHRYDCSDFRAQLLFKIYKDHGDKLSERCKNLIKQTFLDFKYYPDEPGADSMCYWSENHQLLFAAAEYLAGREWPYEVFSNSKMTGEQHRKKAEERIFAWMNQRMRFGFSEYLSNNYLAEDLAPMGNIIAYCGDDEMKRQMKKVTDLLWLDVALNSVNGRLAAVSSRMYGNNKAGNFYGNAIAPAMNLLWGEELCRGLLSDETLSEREKTRIKEGLEKRPNHILICFTDIVKKGLYTLPGEIKKIAMYRGELEVRMGCGLSPRDLVTYGLVGQEPYQIMAQLGAETFTNPEVIENTVKFLRKNKMQTNSFVSYFKYLDMTVLRPVNIKKFAEKHNIMPHGIAIGRGNIYTYRTARFALSTAIDKDAGRCGAQDHDFSANISEEVCLFTTHPAGNGNNRFASSPGYWIGNGRRPMSVQNKNVNITIYKLPKKRRLAEFGIAQITHAYMPVDFYDEFELDGDLVLARKNGVFVALRSNGNMTFKPYDTQSLKGLFANLKRELAPEYLPQKEFDLVRSGGEYHIYVTEISDIDRETYDEFKARIKNNKITFGTSSARYTTQAGEISASYDGDFTVNGKPMPKTFSRCECSAFDLTGYLPPTEC